MTCPTFYVLFLVHLKQNLHFASDSVKLFLTKSLKNYLKYGHLLLVVTSINYLMRAVVIEGLLEQEADSYIFADLLVLMAHSHRLYI